MIAPGDRRVAPEPAVDHLRDTEVDGHRRQRIRVVGSESEVRLHQPQHLFGGLAHRLVQVVAEAVREPVGVGLRGRGRQRPSPSPRTPGSSRRATPRSRYRRSRRRPGRSGGHPRRDSRPRRTPDSTSWRRGRGASCRRCRRRRRAGSTSGVPTPPAPHPSRRSAGVRAHDRPAERLAGLEIGLGHRRRGGRRRRGPEVEPEQRARRRSKPRGIPSSSP